MVDPQTDDPRTDDALPARISRFSLLEGATEAQVARFAEAGEEVRLRSGETLMEEGEEADSLYLLLEGRVEVLKAAEDGSLHPLGEREAGRSLGDWSWVQGNRVEGGRRTATVRAMTDCALLRISFARLDERTSADPALGNLLLRNIGGLTVSSADELGVQKLRTELKAAEEKAFAARFMVSVLITTVFYMYALGLVINLVQDYPSTFVGLPILAFFALAVLVIIRRSERPLSFYGLTMKGWPGHLREALLATLPLLLLTVGIKFLLIQLLPSAAGRPLFELGANEGMSTAELAVMMGCYTLFVPIQEMIARSGLQAPLESLMEGRGRAIRANLIASLLFSMTHLHLTAVLALTVFPLGIYWGLLFRRQGSLFGACVSHILLGNFAFVIVGFSGIA